MSEATPSSFRSDLHLDSLFCELYKTLREIAAVHVSRRDAGGLIRPTEVVHEAYVKLAGNPAGRWESRVHFLRYAACAIEHVLLNEIRADGADKRGGGMKHVTLHDAIPGRHESVVTAIAITEALQALRALGDAGVRAAEVLCLRILAGATAQEAADALGISKRTADSDWRFALAFLRLRLGECVV